MDGIATTTNRTEGREQVRTPAPPPSRSGPRITPQMIVFGLLVIGIVGGLVYTYLDSAISGLFNALAAKGLLETTVVCVTGEFGRTPTINVNAGRDHFPEVVV